MSGFTRDSRKYGDRIVYEALHTKWSRFHRHCRCDRKDWFDHHITAAGLTIIKEGSGHSTVVGPGLTEGVDKAQLTTDVLWEAITGRPGNGVVQQLHDIDELRPLYPQEFEPQPLPTHTWQKHEHQWCVRGQGMTPGDIVEVPARNGLTTKQKILQIVHTTRNGWQLAHAERIADPSTPPTGTVT